ncbi:MAG TPA: MFS transporter [Thermomicrobiales bacterium]|nr:MFS transporter [Thermomicrobiales bacterium]
MTTTSTPRSQLRRIVQTEAGGWGVLTVVNSAFIQPLLIARGAGQLALGLYISGSSLFNFGAGWMGPRLASRVGSTSRTTLSVIGIGRIVFLVFTAYLILSGNARPELLIPLILLWGLGEGLAVPLWNSFLAGMVEGSERGRWVAMRGQAATIATVPVLVAILIVVLFASRERALPFAYAVAAAGAVLSWFFLKRMFASSPTQPVPPKRSLKHVPETRDARRFLVGVFLFWFASALTWPIIPRYLVNDLHAPTAYFAITPIIGAFIGIAMQPRWGKFGDRAGAARILLVSGAGCAIVPLLWAVAPVYWVGFLVDSVAYVFWPGHALGLTLRAIELVDHEADRPMMLGWTNLAQGIGATISPLIAAVVVGHLSVPIILLVAFVLRGASALVMSGTVWGPTKEPATLASTA